MATPEMRLHLPTGQCKTSCALHILMRPKNLVHFFKCMDSSCSFTSDDNDLFLMHLSSHQEQALLCIYCGLLATSGACLIKHMVTAHGSRKAQCSLCLYRARSKTHLAVHAAIAHEGSVLPWYLCKDIAPPVEQPLSLGDISGVLYRCVNGSKIARVQTCRFFCFTTDAFHKHLQENHSGRKLYTCHLCKRRNKSPGTLIKHYANSHGFLKAQCFHCDFRVTSEQRAFKHVMEEHADKPFRLLLRSGRASVALAKLKDLSARLLSKFIIKERPNMREALETAARVDRTSESSPEAGICHESGLGNDMPPCGETSVRDGMKSLLAFPPPTDLDQHTVEKRSKEGGLSGFCNKGEGLRELPSEDEMLANLQFSMPEVQSLPSERVCKLHEDNSQELEPLHQGFQLSSVALGACTEEVQEQRRSNSSLQPHNQAVAGGRSECNGMKGLLAFPLPTELDQHTLGERSTEGVLSGYCSTSEDLRVLPGEDEMPADLRRSTPKVQSVPSKRMCKLHEDNSQELEPLHQGSQVSSVILGSRTKEVQEQGRRNLSLQPHNKAVAGGRSECNSMKGLLVFPLPTELDQPTLEERSTEGVLSGYFSTGEDLRELPGKDEMPADLCRSMPEVRSVPCKRMCKLHEVNSQELEPSHQRSQVSSVILGSCTKEVQEQGRRNSSLQPHNQPVATNAVTNVGASRVGSSMSPAGVGIIFAGELASDYNYVGPCVCVLCNKRQEKVAYFQRMSLRHGGMFFCNRCATRGVAGLSSILQSQTGPRPALEALASNQKWVARKRSTVNSHCPRYQKPHKKELLREALNFISDSGSTDTTVCEVQISDNEREVTTMKYQRRKSSSPMRTPQSDPYKKSCRNSLNAHDSKNSLPSNFGAKSFEIAPGRPPAPEIIDQKSVVQLALKNSDCCPKESLQTCPPTDRVVQGKLPNAHSALTLERTEDLPEPVCIRRRQGKHRLAAPDIIDRKPVVQLALKSSNCCPKESLQTCPPTDRVVQGRLPNAHSAPTLERTEDLPEPVCIRRRQKKHRLAALEIIDQKPLLQLALKNSNCCPKGSLQTCSPTDRMVQGRLPNAHSALTLERTEDLAEPVCIRRQGKHRLAAPEIIDQKPLVQLALKNSDCCPNGSLQTCPPTDRVAQGRLPNAHSAPTLERTENPPEPVCIRRRQAKHRLAALEIIDRKPVVQLALKNSDCFPKGSLQTCPSTYRVVQGRLFNTRSAPKFERTDLPGPPCIRQRQRKHRLAAPKIIDQKPVVQWLAAPEIIDQKPVVQLALKNTDCCPKGPLQTCPPTDRGVQKGLSNARSAPKFESTEDLPGPLRTRQRKKKDRLASKILASNARCIAKESLSGNSHFVTSQKPCRKRSLDETAIIISGATSREALVVNSDPEDEVTATTSNGFSYYGLKSQPLNSSKLFVCDSSLRIPYDTFVSARKFQPRLLVPKFGIADFIGQNSFLQF